MSLVIDFSAIDGSMLAIVGGKAANLGELHRLLPAANTGVPLTDSCTSRVRGENVRP